MVRRILASSRYFMIIAVLGAFIASIVTIIYGTITMIRSVWLAFLQADFTPASAKYIAVDAVELIDVLFVGIVLYIVAEGLYTLFIDEKLPVPPWLHIDTLEQLKNKIIGVLVVLLAVTFLGQAVEWNGGTSIWAFGVSVALVIAALSALLIFTDHDSHAPPHDDSPPAH